MTLHRRIGDARYLLLAVLAILGVFALLHTTTAQVPQVPDPHEGASTPVREQNIDGSGWIKVHEQGQANGHVTNASLPVSGEVSVSNFPQTLIMSVPPASLAAYGEAADAGESATTTFPTPVNATAIAVWDSSLTGDNNPEFQLEVLSPLNPNGYLFQYSYDDGLDSHDIRSFAQPIPITGVTVRCRNESDYCTVGVAVIGTPATP